MDHHAKAPFITGLFEERRSVVHAFFFGTGLPFGFSPLAAAASARLFSFNVALRFAFNRALLSCGMVWDLDGESRVQSRNSCGRMNMCSYEHAILGLDRSIRFSFAPCSKVAHSLLMKAYTRR